MGLSVKVRIPGTTANCGPGFDTIGVACSIYNELELTLHDREEIRIEVSGEGSSAIPKDDRNLVYKAVQLVLNRIGVHYPGIFLRMNNSIPLASGLGSSAAAIVGGLVGANAITGEQLSQQDILDMATAMEGHPDNVAPAIFGGITISAIHDKVARYLRFLPPRKLDMIVAIPQFSLSTKISRQVLPREVPFGDAVFNISRTALLVGALCQGKFELLQCALDDRIHQPYRQPLIPGMQDVCQAAVKSGAFGAVISGAGPCLMAFSDENSDEIGQSMVRAFALHNTKARYISMSIDVEGAKIIS